MNGRLARFWMLLLAFLLLGVTACRVTNLPLWGPVEEALSPTYEVERVRDVAYYTGADADAQRHALDLYLPRGIKDYPVVMLVHGGAWMMGDNRCCGLYSAVGEHLARCGIGVVMPNYRLSPWVKHPEHIKDVARAFAWTKRHIAEHGGRTDRLFLVGHSAGGHLVALLATNEKYLRAEGCTTADIQGVVGISGVYRIPAGSLDVLLGGSSSLAFRLDEVAPLRTANGPRRFLLDRPLSIPVTINVFGLAFGNDAQVRTDASPIEHVRPGLPPFLFINPDNELPILGGMAEQMHTALHAQGCATKLVTVPGRNHSSIVFKAIESTDPAAHAIVSFVREISAR